MEVAPVQRYGVNVVEGIEERAQRAFHAKDAIRNLLHERPVVVSQAQLVELLVDVGVDARNGWVERPDDFHASGEKRPGFHRTNLATPGR